LSDIVWHDSTIKNCSGSGLASCLKKQSVFGGWLKQSETKLKIMKKLALAITAAIFAAGFGMVANAQTLLYEWNFTNTLTTTPTSSVPTYAYIPGTGILSMQNHAGTAAGTNVYFTNGPAVGPGSGAGGSGLGELAFVGQAYGGGSPSAITWATNLNIGQRVKFTVTFWFQLGASAGTASGTFPRIVMLGAGTGYDSGSSGTGVGVGASLNNWTLADGPNDGNYFAQEIQNGNGNNSGQVPGGTTGKLPNQFTLPEETQFGNANSNGIVASANGPLNNTNWYFEAMTFDGSLPNNQFNSWLGTQTTNVVHVDAQAGAANMLPQPNFGTNAVLYLANRFNGARTITDGGIADVRIYAGVCSSNNLEAIRTFSANFVDDGSGGGNTAPDIQLPPASGNTHAGLSRSFNVIASGLAPLSYQWKTNNVAVLNATNATLTLSNVPLGFNGMQITVTVTNLLGNTNTTLTPATLTVVQAPANSYAAAVVAQNPFIYWHLNETTNGSATPANPLTIFDYASGLDGLAVDPTNMTFNFTGLDGPVYPGFSSANRAIETHRDTFFSRLNMAALPAYTNDMTICGWIYVTNTPPSSFGIIYSLNGGNNGSTVGFGYGLYFDGNSGTDANGNTTVELSYNWNISGLPTPFASGLYVPVKEWTFIALTIAPDGHSASLYMGSHSGGLQMSLDDTNSTGDVIAGTAGVTAPIVLGRTPYSFYEQGQGSANGGNTIAFNDVSIFYKALSAQTITNLYLTGAGIYLFAAPDPNLAGNLLLTYPVGTLQQSATVTGPYTDVPGATNPYSVPMTSSQEFFRLRY
jgi:hypothetical protein